MATNRLLVKEEVNTYASILLRAAKAGGQERVVKVYDEMEQIVGLIYSDMEFAQALSDTGYTSAQRETLARKVFASCDPDLCAVLAVMAGRGDIKLLPRVRQAYVALMDTMLEVAIVDVVTAVSLDDDLRRQIRSKIEADLGKSVLLRESVDPSILGGIIMSTGGKRIDASVAMLLGRARQTLKERTNGGESS